MSDQSRTWAGVDGERLRQGLRIVALRALGDPDVVDDVVQETLARTARALREGRVRERDRVAAFARGIARNVIVDVIRERSRRKSLPDAGGRHQDPAPDALETLVTAEEKRRLVAALSRLSSADRGLLHLVFYEGLTSAEICEQLGLRYDLFRKRKSRAVERLRRAFLGAAVKSHNSEDSPTDITDISDASTTDGVRRQR